MFPLASAPDADCLLRRLLADEPWRADVPWPDGFAGGIAHRLDNATSGAVAVARDPEALRHLRALFASRSLTKRYLLWTARSVPWDEHVCERPIAHARGHRGRMVVQRGQSTPHRGRWQEARTAFRRVSVHVFEARMRTGVRHQIRLHAAFLGIALAGDRRYGGGPPPPWAEAEFALHHVGFTGPGARTEPVPTPAWTVP